MLLPCSDIMFKFFKALIIYFWVEGTKTVLTTYFMKPFSNLKRRFQIEKSCQAKKGWVCTENKQIQLPFKGALIIVLYQQWDK